MKSNLIAAPIAVAVALALAATDASAQSADKKLDTITVTGTRQAYQGNFDEF